MINDQESALSEVGTLLNNGIGLLHPFNLESPRARVEGENKRGHVFVLLTMLYK